MYGVSPGRVRSLAFDPEGQTAMPKDEIYLRAVVCQSVDDFVGQLHDGCHDAISEEFRHVFSNVVTFAVFSSY